MFVGPSDHPRVTDALGELGVGGGPGLDVVERDGQCRLWWEQTPVDLFFAYDALHDAMRQATRREPFADTTIPVLSPEHLVVCKAIFDRPKDWLDIEQVVVAVSDLDVAETLSWLDRTVGPDDPRREHLADLAAMGE